MTHSKTRSMSRSKLVAAVFAALAVGMAAACGDPLGPPTKLDELPRQLGFAERELVAASNDFTFRLLREVMADPELDSGNVVLSPFSVSMALGMTLNGAAGETFDSMRATLGFGGLDQTQINESYRDLASLLVSLDGRTELGIANSVWAREGFPFEPDFFQAVRSYFGAETRELDFSAPNAKDVINDWVHAATGGRIDEIIRQIRMEDVMFLVNAVYFKGQWTSRFDVAQTRPARFEVEGAGPVDVPTMHSSAMEVGVFHLPDGVEGGELPYGNQAFTMVVAMPPPGGSLDDLVADLDDATWAHWMEQISYRERSVALPRFETEYAAGLIDPLARMGMGIAFDPNRADLSRLTPAASAHINRVSHKTFLKVDEEGTEAAAVTAVGVGVTSVPAGLFVNRPFLVAIREQLSGTVLFVGVIRDPR